MYFFYNRSITQFSCLIYLYKLLLRIFIKLLLSYNMAKVNDKIKKTSNVKQKSLRMSTRLQERVVQQSLAENLPAVSQPAQSEPLDIVPTTSMDYICSISNK